MSIKSLKVLNVMIFQRQWRKNNGDTKDGAIKEGDSISDAFKLDFSDGINVIIGENGVGKTTILKMIYAATQWSIPQTDKGKADRLLKFFSSNSSDSDILKNNNSKEDYCYFEVSDGEHTFKWSLSHKGLLEFDKWSKLNIQSVFIPTTEMLSHAKGFLALDKKFKLPFDGTQVDIIVNASLPETREIPKEMEGILKKISDAIDGEVVIEEDTFYVKKSDGSKIEFSLEAEGLRKLGLLWKLIRNGLLEKGSILLWDEPEANLNPELYSLVVDILLELEKRGIQVFVSTHSYNLAKYFEIRREKVQQVKFHNIYKSTADVPVELHLSDIGNSGSEIYSDSADYLSEIEENHIIMADEKLLDEALQKNLVD